MYHLQSDLNAEAVKLMDLNDNLLASSTRDKVCLLDAVWLQFVVTHSLGQYAVRMLLVMKYQPITVPALTALN